MNTKYAKTLSAIAYRAGAVVKHDRAMFGDEFKREGPYHFALAHHYDGRTLGALERRGLVARKKVDMGDHWEHRVELTEKGMSIALWYVGEGRHPDRFWDTCHGAVGCRMEHTVTEVGTTCAQCGYIVGDW